MSNSPDASNLTLKFTTRTREKDHLGTNSVWTLVEFYPSVPHLFQDYSNTNQGK